MVELTVTVLESEIATIERDPYVAQWSTMLTPQDETILTKGGARGADLYDEIRRDPHAFAVLQKRTLEVTSREWQVLAASERRADKKAADLVERQLKGLNFDRLTAGLMNAILKGYAVAEVIWELRGGEWWAARIKVKRQRRFKFAKDGTLRIITREKGLEGEPVPDRKFIVHRHSIDQTDDDPYGLGLGTVLFWPAWFKRQVLAHWLQATERYASPTILAQYEGDFDDQRRVKLLAAIRTVGRDAGMAVPKSVEVGLLEAKGGGGGALQEPLSRYLDELMSEAVLGETLSTNSGERGARSLGEIHNDVRVAIAKSDADGVCSTINDTLVRWIVELNGLTTDAGLPQVWRDFSEGEDLDKRAERDKTIFDMGYETGDPSYFDDTYGGTWVKKAQPTIDPSATDPTAAMDRTAALFAEPTAAIDEPTAALVDQLGEIGAPAIDAMVETIRQTVMSSTSFADLAERLLSLSGEIDVSDLAAVMEDAMIVANLTGRSEVLDGR